MFWVYNKLKNMKHELQYLASKLCSKGVSWCYYYYEVFLLLRPAAACRNQKTEVSIFPTHATLSHIFAFVKTTFFPTWTLHFQFCMSNSCVSFKIRLRSNAISIKELLTLLNRYILVLTGMVQWVEHCSTKQTANSAIPGQGTCLGCRLVSI